MSNAESPAQAQSMVLDPYENRIIVSDYDRSCMGLTKREHFAGLAMQGLISNHGNEGAEAFASYAVEYANALLKALEARDDL